MQLLTANSILLNLNREETKEKVSSWFYSENGFNIQKEKLVTLLHATIDTPEVLSAIESVIEPTRLTVDYSTSQFISLDNISPDIVYSSTRNTTDELRDRIERLEEEVMELRQMIRRNTS